MNWELFFLVCFVVGFSFSVISFVGGLGRFHLHFHLPKHLHVGGFGHGGAHGFGGARAASAAHGAGDAGHVKTTSGPHFSVVNPMTMAAFLTLFGGIGYFLVPFRHIWVFSSLCLSSLLGTRAA